MGDYHARFCESLEVRFFGATRLIMITSHYHLNLKPTLKRINHLYLKTNPLTKQDDAIKESIIGIGLPIVAWSVYQY